MTANLGDIKEDDTIHFLWSSNDSNGASITRATNGTVQVYKDNGTTQSTAGVTDTEDFDALTGIHACTIDLSADAFYAAGANYSVVLSGATIDGQSVNAVLAHFAIENRLTSNIYSDTTIIHSDTVVISSDTAKIESDTAKIESDTTVIESDTTKIESDAVVIESNTIVIESDTIVISSDTAKIESDTAVIESDTTKIESDSAVIESDTTVIESDTTVIEAETRSVSLVTTTIATLASQTSFTLTDGSADNDAYNGATIVITDSATAAQVAVGRIDDYVGSTKTVTLESDPGIFVMAAGDKVDIFAESPRIDKIYSDTTVAVSDTTVIESDTTKIESDAAVIESDTTKIESDATVIESDTTAIHSDTTIIASDVVQIYSDTTVIASDVVQVYSDTTVIASDLVIVGSDTAAIEVDTGNIYSDTTIIHSDTIVISSDTAKIESDTAVIESDTTAIHSDTTIIASDVVIVASDVVQLVGVEIPKNAAFSNFEFLMIDSTDDVSPKTGLTVSGERSIDGGAFAAVSGTIAEVGNGIYQFDALAADTNGDVITWRFTAAGANDTLFTFTTA